MSQVDPTHIYIVGFSDGKVKVGRTSNLARRMATLRSVAKHQGATLDAGWATAHADPRSAEWYLRLIGRSRFTRVAGSSEYFRADYDVFLRTSLAVMDKWGHHPMPVGMQPLPDPAA